MKMHQHLVAFFLQSRVYEVTCRREVDEEGIISRIPNLRLVSSLVDEQIFVIQICDSQHQVVRPGGREVRTDGQDMCNSQLPTSQFWGLRGRQASATMNKGNYLDLQVQTYSPRSS